VKKYKVNLTALVVLILVFAVALTATLLGQGPRKALPKYQDLGTAVKLTSVKWEESKAAPQKPYTGPVAIASPSALLSEGFEGGAVPPTGWSAVVNNPYTWEIDSYSPYEGVYNASCFYDETYSGTQDEWLISPAIDLSSKGSDWNLYFSWMGSYYWAVDPYDNYDLEVWISTDGGSNFSTQLWSEEDVGVFTTWQWYRQSVDLSGYLAETNVKLGFRYYGYDGAQFSLDYIVVDIPQVGRCCYGDPMSPSCADVTEEACNGLSGSWTEGLNCTDNPCPIVGEGDDCSNPIPVSIPAALPYTDASQTTCGRIDDYNGITCLGYYDGGEDIIYKLTVSSATNVDITLDPKGTAWTGVAIDNACPPGATCMAYSTNSGSTAHGMTGVALTAGTYYIMVDTWPSPDCIPDFDLTITEAAPPPANDLCTGAPVISTFPSTVYGTNIGATIDCPGFLDWNAVWYKFELPYDNNDVFIDFCDTPAPGYVWTVGVILYDECPQDCPNYILRTGYQWVTCGNGLDNPQIWWENLPGNKGGDYWFPAYVLDVGDNPMNFGFTVTVTEWVPHYCDGWATTSDEYIQRVKTGTIDNTTGWDGYGDYTAISTDMKPGTGYPITVTVGNAYSSDAGGVWVDWNQDLDWDDAGEQVTLSGSPGYGPYTGTITPPPTAALGPTRMRVRLVYNTTPAPCGGLTYGDVEDYTINVLSPNEPPTCAIAPPGPFSIYEGEGLSFTLTGTDPDAGDIITLSGTGIPAGATMTPSLPVTGSTPRSSTFNWATGPGNAGSYALNFTVTDDEQLTCTCPVSITVNPNAPPVCAINPPGPISVIEGNPVNFQVTATDADGDVVTINGSGIPAGATMNPPLPVVGTSPRSSSFNWTPGTPDIGNYTVSFDISDAHGLSSRCQMQIQVKEQPAVSSMTPIGLIFLILAVVGFFAFIIIRKRRVSTTR
jgi:hypothetical protein